jgi:rod shape determining protein RodA
MERRFLRQLDWVLIVSAMALLAIGSAMVYSATSSPHDARAGYGLLQLVWLGIGLLAAAVAASVPTRAYDGAAPYLYALSLALLVLVLVAGQEVSGARRWLALGPLRFQPSELAKLATLLLLARLLSKKESDLRRLSSWLLPTAAAAVPAALVLRQPNLSTAIAFGVLLLASFYWAGLPIALLVVALLPILNAVLYLVSGSAWTVAIVTAGALLWTRPRLPWVVLTLLLNGAVVLVLPAAVERLESYQRRRIETFLNPGQDPHGAGYQIIQSRIAIGSGGALGRGYLQGRQKSLQFLPEKHTDFIFSVVGEELGFWGTSLVLALYLVLLLRGLWVALVARSRFASLTAFGITMLLFFHLMVNVLMTVGWAPVTGIPLPFLSYGGTALVITCVQVGVLVGIHYRRQEY